ncbi:hypothetical protein GCM10010399_48400 [Dactylosporangium fulvum]|uniref:Uncharacterized protein n=1 Tax=Dactylosporangium fulvum TaxID=53359 RepID=A0ABY5VTU4_9ACTN|nr:hypothetical protein [Dactylosporangium fulvum]UWP80574.1 hypothetical protein Dfulv_36210 [Dactylosporangium fulvum]
MDVNELRGALLSHIPDPDAVLRRLAAKRRAQRRRRMILWGSAFGIAVAVVVAALVWSAGAPQPLTTQAAQSGAAQMSSPSSSSTGPEAANGCGGMLLTETLARARQAGGSIVLAHGTLTGRSTADPEVQAEMVLNAVETLAGPPVADRTMVWLSTARGPSGPIPGADAGSLWAPDGSLFGIVWPQRLTNWPTGTTLRVAPVVDQQVIFSNAGCWAGVEGQPFTGKLAEVPGSDSYARAARTGFTAVPLDTVRRAATG